MKTITVLIALLSALHVHDFHSSVTQVDYNGKNRSLEITVRLFTDDLCSALQNNGAPKMELGTPEEPPSANEFIESYLREHLKVKINGKPAPFIYLGKEAQLDATWCYVEIQKVGSVRKLEVENTIMLKEFDDQTNLINLNVKGQKKSGIARNESSTLKFDF